MSKSSASRPQAEGAAESEPGRTLRRRCDTAPCAEHERTARRLASLVASVQVGILEEAADRRVMMTNRAFCDLLGLEDSPMSLVGRPTVEVLGRARRLFGDLDGELARMDALARARRRRIADELTLTDGRIVERDYLPGDLSEGLDGHFWVFRDITACRRTAAELKRTEARYHDVVESGIVAAWSHDLSGVVLSANSALGRILGAPVPEALVGCEIQKTMAPEYRHLWSAYLREVVDKGESRGLGTFSGLDGRHRVIAFSNVLRKDAHGNPVVIGFGEDVTELARAEHALRQRSKLEKHLVTISTRLINLSAASIDEAIDQALEELARELRVNRGTVYVLSRDGAVLELTHQWSGATPDGVPPPQERLAVEDLPVVMRRLRRLEPYPVVRLGDLGPGATRERATLERLEIRSLLVVPISTGGELMGFVGLSMHHEEREWSEDVVSVVRVIGDIIGGAMDRRRGEAELEAANRALAVANRVLEENHRKMSLLNEMGDMVLTAQGLDEVRALAASFVPRIFSGISGALYLYDAPDRQQVEPVVTWGGAAPGPGPVRAEDCWALRRSRPHEADGEASGPVCAHASDVRDDHSLCLPLMANGQLLGLLHLRQARLHAAGQTGDLGDARQVAYNTAEQLALGLANLQLRDSLRSQALHDPLTGLHNRRYLEERLERELHRAERADVPLAVLMLDLDRFKRVNDVFGHATGDRVLTRVARFLEAGVRAEDVVARYGGEEFTVLLAGTSEEDARWVAEKLRKGVRRVAATLGEPGPDTLSLSIGLAVWPTCAGSAEDLLEAADAALYTAKRGGRDRVVVAAPALPERARGEV